MLKLSLLNDIGEEITACRRTGLCRGIVNRPENGIYPRCFYPEIHDKESEHFDGVVIGLNPGTASPLEMAFTKYIREREGGVKYSQIKTVSEPTVKNHLYYMRVRAFLRKYLNKKDMNILWTELVKCQSKRDNGNKLPLGLSTKKQCFDTFLRREIEIFAENRKPLLIFLGREVLSFVTKYRKRHFLGFKYLSLYHPTGGFGAPFFQHFKSGNIDGELEKIDEKTFK